MIISLLKCLSCRFNFVESYEPGQPVVVYGQLRHEQKMSVVHFLLKRSPENRTPIKSKESMVFHVGYRRFTASPIYSQHTNGSKHKVSIDLSHGSSFFLAIEVFFFLICVIMVLWTSQRRKVPRLIHNDFKKSIPNFWLVLGHILIIDKTIGWSY